MIPTNWTLNAIIDAAFLRKAVLVALALGLIAAASVLPLLYAVALIAGAGALLLLLRWPELGLPLLIFSIPYGYFSGGGSDGSEVPLTEPLVFLVAAVWLARWISSGARVGRIRLQSAPLYMPLLAFLWLVTFSLTTAPALASSAKEVLKWAAVLVTYALVISTVKTRRHVALLLATVFVAAISESVIGFYQFVAKAGPDGFLIGSFLRAYGTFGQPNPYAGYLAIAAAMAFGLVLYSIRTWFGRASRPRHSRAGGNLPNTRRRAVDSRFRGNDGAGARAGYFHRNDAETSAPEASTDKPSLVDRVGTPLLLLSWVTFGACVMAIVMSMSRGAWLGLAAGLAIAVTLSSRRALWIMLVVLVILGLFLGLGLMQMLPAQIVARITDAVSYFGVFDVTQVELTPENWPIVERMAHWQAAWSMYLDHPFLGVGIGNYPDAYPEYYIANWKDPMGHAHNLYLNMLAEMGLIGLTGYLLLIGSFFGHGLRVLRRLGKSLSNNFERYMLIGIIGALVAVSVHNVLDNLFVHGIDVELGLMLGLITVLGNLAKDRRVGELL